MTLERRDLVEATRERHPPHYHVALFPSSYRRYVTARGGAVEPAPGTQLAASRRHQVRHGDTLWAIARRYGTSVAALESTNGVRAHGLRPGQVLEIPAAAR